MGATVAAVPAQRRPAGILAALGRRLPKSTWGLADQALLSATSFVTMILLARVLSPVAFGAFTLLYTTVMLIVQLQSTVVTQPHNVLGVARAGSAYQSYTSSTAVMQLVFAFLAGAPLLIAAGAAAALGSSAASVLLALAAACVAWLGQEFVRRVLYTEVRLREAFANDLISYGGQAVAIAALWQFDRLTVTSALFVLAATSALGVVLGLWQTRRSFARAFDRDDVRANWNFGKWLAGGFVAYWFSSQLYLYLAAAIIGAAATGTLKAALIVMGPLNVLLVFIDTTTPILLARRLASTGERAMHAQLKLTLSWVAPLVGAYCLLAAVFAGPLLHLFYGERYADGTTVLALLAIDYFVIALNRTLGAAVRAKRLTKQVFKANVCSAVAAASVGWMMIEVGGVNGAVVGMIASAVITGVVLLRGYAASLRTASEPVEGFVVGLESHDR